MRTKENQNIAIVFFRAAYMESWGRGFEKIVEACEAMEAPLPKVRCEHTGLWIEFPFKKLPETPPKTPPEGSPESSPKGSPKTSELILELIRNNSDITTMIMASQLGISKRAVIKHTNKLQENGKLRRVGSKKGGHWEVIDEE
ncbi:MAG: winged helix-turn-helix transcriptional regulator [Kiritimatiellae bacterium]|jgi:ATP-dependent DNA helicase RecG|nr:winged helix-turn-helix transcriptional regulator [Kiritimatiellia bacterium]